MKKKIFAITCLVIFLSLMAFLPAAAQDTTLNLSLNRTMGYGGMNNDIQGLFTMKVTGPESVVRVAFYLDDTLMGEDADAPFGYQFSTDSYPPGFHELKAVGFTIGGDEFTSNTIRVEFVSEDEVGKRMIGVIGPILVIVALAVVGAAVIPVLMRGGKPIPLGQPRRYTFGGTMCPKCGRPFDMSILKLNLLVGSLDRCPHCGKWSLVRRMPLNVLRDAEAAELEQSQSRGEISEITEEEKLKRDLDASRFQDN